MVRVVAGCDVRWENPPITTNTNRPELFTHMVFPIDDYSPLQRLHILASYVVVVPSGHCGSYIQGASLY